MDRHIDVIKSIVLILNAYLFEPLQPFHQTQKIE